ncbi:MAG: SUMF1/EgtB/PvdO family nonheme iron enzyme [Deltaproteobacteria bacterium]|nr:SUMF1/EgtB/PvdO family nonheme iron enzyme [Deltaproteobacteria bacterium]
MRVALGWLGAVLLLGCAGRGRAPAGAGAEAMPADMVLLPAGATTDGFLLDRLEVSVADYQRCVDAGVCNAPTKVSSSCRYLDAADAAGLPMSCLVAGEPERYCAWRGRRLPSGREWVRAARGEAGRAWPWGEAARACAPGDDCAGVRTPWRGGSGADVSPEGVHDLAGNLREWTSDGWHGDPGRPIQLYTPNWPDLAFITYGGFGFRCARDVESASARVEAPALHGMLMFGETPSYLYHLPMFRRPHDHQVLLVLQPDGALTQAYVAERAARAASLYTVVPEPGLLAEVVRPRSTRVGRLVRGHFERGGTTLMSGELAVSHVLQFRRLAPELREATLDYLLVGNRREAFLIHLIGGRPSFDQVLRVAPPAEVDELVLARGVRVSFPGHAPGQPLPAGRAQVARLGARQLTLAVGAEVYRELDELR